MLRRLSSTLALLVAAAPLAAHATQAQSPADPETPPISLGTHRTGPAPAGGPLVAERYRMLLRNQLATYAEGPELERLIDERRQQLPYRKYPVELSVSESPPEWWRFEQPAPGQSWPSRAVQVIDRSTADIYAVERFIHCDDSAADCETFVREATQRAAEQPRQPWASPAHAQWRERVLLMPCEDGPVSMSAPPYPPAAVRMGVQGQVRVIVLTDRCGLVHGAWVDSSSGNRDLDLAAIEHAHKWRVPIPADQPRDRGFMSRIPVSFAF